MTLWSGLAGRARTMARAHLGVAPCMPLRCIRLLQVRRGSGRFELGASEGDRNRSQPGQATALLKSFKLEEMLYLAARSGHKEVLEYLLERVAPNASLNYGAVAAGAAIAGHETLRETVSFSISLHFASVSFKIGAKCLRNALEVLRSRAQRGGAWHPWALHGCVLCGHHEAVAKLLAQGASQDTDATGTRSLNAII